MKDNQLTTNGGRVLCVVSVGDSIFEAVSRAQRATELISFRGAQYRTDIGHREIIRWTLTKEILVVACV